MKTLESLKETHQLVVTLEDGIVIGGFGSKIAQYYGTSNMRVLNCGFPMKIPNRYMPQEWMEKCRLTPKLIVEDILFVLREIGEKC